MGSLLRLKILGSSKSHGANPEVYLMLDCDVGVGSRALLGNL